MHDPVAHIIGVADGVSATAGQPPQRDTENQDQNHGQPEFRNTAHHRAQPAQQLVHPAILVPRAQKPQPQRAQKGQHKAHATQQQRVACPLDDDLHHRLLVLIGDTEIAVEGVFQPHAVLLQQRLVQSQLCPCLRLFRHGHFLHPLAVIGAERIAGGETGHAEYRQRQQPHADKEDQDFFCDQQRDVLSHWPSSSPVRTKCPGSTSPITPSRRKVMASKSSRRRWRSRIGSGSGIADSSALV